MSPNIPSPMAAKKKPVILSEGARLASSAVEGSREILPRHSVHSLSANSARVPCQVSTQEAKL
jgi:hypothetical protein